MEKDILIPKFNEDKCLKCGRCYLACNDSGYQAISFPTHLEVPTVIPTACTGCALCHAGKMNPY